MSNYHHGILTRVFVQHFLKVGKARFRPKGVVDNQLTFIPHFVSYQSRSLGRSFKWAGDDDFHLNAKRGQGAADVAALLDANLIEAAFFVFLCIAKPLPSAGM